jgi:formylmethanofuran dehydrogenase subunit E
VEQLVEVLQSRGLSVAYVKRSHHQLDLPEKASGRVWARRPAAMVQRTAERVQLTLHPCGEEASAVLARVPDGMDVVLLETHTAEPYPTILSNLCEPAPDEEVIARWSLFGDAAGASAALPEILQSIPENRELDRALRAAIQLHGGRGCAGLVLGTRLAMAGAAKLALAVPDTQKRLVVIAETDRCALDGIQAVTGCRLSRRNLRLLDYGKVAATFYDEWTGAAVRVNVRGDLRERVGGGADTDLRHRLQRQAYGTWPDDELFALRPVEMALSQFESPGRPRQRVACGACGEEVADGRDVMTESGPRCLPCSAAVGMEA